MRTRIWNQGTFSAIFLLLVGLFLLLKNLGVFNPWGEAIWGGLFAAVGLAFLGAFIIDPRQWWRSIPGFILISIGALILLQWQKIELGAWRTSVVLFGIALGFWSALLANNENWWAAIPAGILTELGILRGLENRLDATTWLALFLGRAGPGVCADVRSARAQHTLGGGPRRGPDPGSNYNAGHDRGRQPASYDPLLADPADGRRARPSDRYLAANAWPGARDRA